MKELGELSHRVDFAEWLQDRRLLGWGAEIGVAEGTFSESILSGWSGKGLHLVDLWNPGKGTGHSTEQMSVVKHEQRYRQCRERLARFKSRIVYHRTWSHIASTKVLDGSLDFVFIDASHIYPWVVLDLHLWYPKLCIGGLFSGHDYIPPKASVGVKWAVDEFAARLDASVTTIQEHPTSASWAFIKERELYRDVL